MIFKILRNRVNLCCTTLLSMLKRCTHNLPPSQEVLCGSIHARTFTQVEHRLPSLVVLNKNDIIFICCLPYYNKYIYSTQINIYTQFVCNHINMEFNLWLTSWQTIIVGGVIQARGARQSCAVCIPLVPL